MGAYPSDRYQLSRLDASSPDALYDGVAALIAEQSAEEGRQTPPDAVARLRKLAEPGSSALVHALLDGAGEARAYQLSNVCASLGGRFLYVNETYVSRELRGLGLGAVLMKNFLDWARAGGFTHVYSYTDSPEMKKLALHLGATVGAVDWVDFPLTAPR